MTTRHTAHAFDEDLDSLRRLLAEMGHVAVDLTRRSTAALLARDREAAPRVVEADGRLDELRSAVEELAIGIIARRQPMAGDLREVVGAMRMAGDLERIGDHAKNTARRALSLGEDVDLTAFSAGVRGMADLVGTQLRRVMRAVEADDAESALAVWMKDGEVDALFTSLFRELLTYMMEDPRSITSCTHLMFCAKNIERIGDRATNIAETLYFVVRGEQLGEDRPRADGTSSIAAP